MLVLVVRNIEQKQKHWKCSSHLQEVEVQCIPANVICYLPEENTCITL